MEAKLESVLLEDSKRNSFYFQQRRGSLDIRSLSKIDLDIVVREVDIDSLQSLLENIAFCNITENDLRFLTDPLILKLFRVSQLLIEYLLYTQEDLIEKVSLYAKKYAAKKRDLLKKRQELVILQESTEHLNRQVKLKRENIRTLEALLKKASSKKIHHVQISNNPPEQMRSFQATLSQETQTEHKVLEPYSSHEELNEETKSHTEKVQQESKNNVDLFIFMTEKWNKLETSLRGQLEEQLIRQEIKVEEVIRDISKKKLEIGILETDSDSQQLQVKEVNPVNRSALLKPFTPACLNNSEFEVETMEPIEQDSRFIDLLKSVKAREKEIQDLKQQLLLQSQSQPKNTYHLPESVETVKTVDTDVVVDKENFATVNNNLTSPEEDDQTVDVLYIDETEIPDIPLLVGDEFVPVVDEAFESDTILPNSNDTRSETQENSSLKQQLSGDDSLQSQIEIKDIKIIFELSHNPDIAIFLKERVEVVIDGRMRDNISVDDLVFEIRRSIAQQLSIPLARVVLVLENQIVTLGLDIKDIGLDANLASELAEKGGLTLKIRTGEVISDSQLDLFVSSWEKKNPNLLASSVEDSSIRTDNSSRNWSALLQSVDRGSPKNKGSLEFTNMFQRTWNDFPEQDSDDFERIDNKATIKSYEDSVRSSLQSALSDIEGKQSMTNEELQDKMYALRKLSESLPKNLQSRLIDSKTSFENSYADAAFQADEADRMERLRSPVTLQSKITSKLALPTEKIDKDDDISLASSKDDSSKLLVEAKQGSTNIMFSTQGTNKNIEIKPRYSDDLDIATDDSAPVIRHSDVEASSIKPVKPQRKVERTAKDSSMDYLERKRSGYFDDAESKPSEPILRAEEKIISNLTEVSDLTIDSSLMKTLPEIHAEDTVEWNKTLESETDVPIRGTPVKGEEVKRRADEYERIAALELNNTPLRDSNMDSIQQYNTSVASPFPMMNSESMLSDDNTHSFALSDSVMDYSLSQSIDTSMK